MLAQILPFALLSVALASAQSISIVNPAGQGTPGNPIFFQSSGNSPGTATQQRSISFQAVNAASGNFVLLGVTNSSWLSVDSLTTGPATNNGSLNINVNPAGAPVGISDGVVVVGHQAGTGVISLTIYVRLVVGNTVSVAPLAAFPSTLSFNAFRGGVPPAPQDLTVVSSTTSGSVPGLPFSITTTTVNGLPWLVASVPNGIAVTPTSVRVSIVNQASLAASPFPYSGSVVLTPAAGGAPVVIPVSLTVFDASGGSGGSGAVAEVNVRSLAFQHQAGAAPPAPRTIMVTGSASAFSVFAGTSSGGAWLQVQQSAAGAPGAFQVSISGSVNTLTPGLYNGQLTLTAAGQSNPVVIPVSLDVSGLPQVSLSSHAPVVFSATAFGVAPPPQTITVNTTGGAAANVSVRVDGADWLAATLSRNTTPAQLTLAPSTSLFSPGTRTANVVVTAGGSSVTIPVTLNLLAGSENQLQVDRGDFNFSLTDTVQSLAITSTAVPAAYAIQPVVVTPAGLNWLQVVETINSVTPATVRVAANPAIVPAGNWFGYLAITAPGVAPVYVPVNLTVSSPLFASTRAIAFGMQQGQAAPPAQSFIVSSGSPRPFNLTVSASPANLFDVTPIAGSTPASIQVRPGSAASTLPTGTYRASITVSGLGSPSATVDVTLVITAPVSATVDVRELRFTTRVGSAEPIAEQVIRLGASVDSAYTATVTTDNGGDWLSVSPASGTTPVAVNVQARAAGLASGSYTGAITLTVAGAVAPVRIPVSLAVERVTPQIADIVNAGGLRAGALAPGLLVSIFGTNLGPLTGVTAQPTQGRVGTALGGTRVLFDGIAAPVLFARNDQINCIVPFAMAGRAQTAIQVEVNGVLSNLILPRVAETAPGIFQSANGQAAALNADNSVNAPGNPARRGSVLVLYLTGAGALTPPGVDGELGRVGQQPLVPVSVRLGGVLAETVAYAGSAPGLVQGVLQVNVVVPMGAPVGPAVPVVVTVGGGETAPGATVAVQ